MQLLGRLPAHWEVRRQRHLVDLRVSNVNKIASNDELPVRLCNYVDVYKNERVAGSMSFMRSTATQSEIDRFRLERGDVLVTKDSESFTDIGVPALVEYAAPDLICGYHLAILRPRAGVLDGAYLFRAHQTQEIAAQYHASANGVTRFGLSHSDLKSIALPVPPLPEQVAIVRFLDHADRRILRYVAAKQRLVGLRNEERQAIVDQAVTRGRDPDVRLKASGAEWLGDVPEHWDVVRLGRLIQLATGFPFRSEAFSNFNQDIPLLRGINVAPGRIRWDTVVRWPAAQRSDFAAYELAEGDIVLGMDRSIVRGGVRVALVGPADVPSLLLQRVARIRPRAELNRDFALLCLSSKPFADYLAPIFTGVSVPHVSPEQIGLFRIGLPSLAEQRQIVDWVGETASAIDASIATAQREIALAREYRARLISDVVTGKVDTRAVAALLPDVSSDAFGPLDTAPRGDEEIEVDAEVGPEAAD